MKNLNGCKRVFYFITIFLIVSSILHCSTFKNKIESVTFYTLKKHPKIRNSNSLRYKLIYGTTKSSELNKNFEKFLTQNDFKKTNYDALKSTKIITFIDSLKSGQSGYEMACLKVYRDIIVYKNGDKITKVVKICTSCYSNQVITKVDENTLVMDFMDYDYLEKLFTK